MKKIFLLYMLLCFSNCSSPKEEIKENHDRNYLNELKVNTVFSVDSLQILNHYIQHQNNKFLVYHVYYNSDVNIIGSGYFITTNLENKILSIYKNI